MKKLTYYRFETATTFEEVWAANFTEAYRMVRDAGKVPRSAMSKPFADKRLTKIPAQTLAAANAAYSKTDSPN